MDLAAEDPYHTIASVIALAGGALVIAAAALCYHLVTGIVVRAGRSPRTPDTRRAAELLKSRFFCRDAYPDRAAPSYWLTFFYPPLVDRPAVGARLPGPDRVPGQRS